eukprot:c18167_g2_i2 orf=44-310(+)
MRHNSFPLYLMHLVWSSMWNSLVPPFQRSPICSHLFIRCTNMFVNLHTSVFILPWSLVCESLRQRVHSPMVSSFQVDVHPTAMIQICV